MYLDAFYEIEYIPIVYIGCHFIITKKTHHKEA